MCIKVVESYAVCGCIYYSHPVDPCPAYGRRDHAVKAKAILVGYSCSRHSSIKPNRSQVSKNSAKYENRLERTTVKATIDSPLRAELLGKSQKVLETDEQFIPTGDLDKVLTIHAIARELRSHSLADISYDVFPSAKKIFAILLVIHKLDALQDLIESGLRDETLPLELSAAGSLEDLRFQSAFSKWDLDTRKKFVDFQWTLLAPVFSEGKHLKLHDDARLPFIRTETIANGAFGGVCRVEIHSDHEKFGLPVTRKNHEFALKQFTQGTEYVNQRAFHRERAVMKSIRSSGHGHIIKFLATFEQSGRYSMILSLAEQNLREFWAHAIPSSLTKQWGLGLALAIPSSVMQQWCLEEMAGIASALSYLHNDLVTPDSRPMSGWHCDLKPENILVTGSPLCSKFSWKISDFGSSYLKPKGSRLELPPHPGLGTYEPPECQLNLPQSQAYDIWSLGCILAECAIWLMEGSEAVEAFAEDRLNDGKIPGNNFRNDYFFTLEFNESLKPSGAIIRPAVIKWIENLERNESCSEAISGLLDLIKNGLLQVDQSKRLGAGHLGQRLIVLHQTAKQFLESDSRSISQDKLQAKVTELEN